MIISFKCKKTEKLFDGQRVPAFSGFQRQAEKRLRILDAADTLESLIAHLFLLFGTLVFCLIYWLRGLFCFEARAHRAWLHKIITVKILKEDSSDDSFLQAMQPDYVTSNSSSVVASNSNSVRSFVRTSYASSGTTDETHHLPSKEKENKKV